jgi:hypothetical protein
MRRIWYGAEVATPRKSSRSGGIQDDLTLPISNLTSTEIDVNGKSARVKTVGGWCNCIRVGAYSCLVRGASVCTIELQIDAIGRGVGYKLLNKRVERVV